MSEFREFEVSLPDGATLSCAVMGQGVPVLWISGLSGMANFWDSICPSLSGIMSITFDQRGLRQSKRGTSDINIERLALDALAILDHLGLEKAHVVGHSTGGCIAMTMALTSPHRISRLVISGSWAGPNPYMSALFGWRQKLLGTDARLYQAILPFFSNTPQWLIDHPDQLALPTESLSTDQIAIVKERIAALMAFDCRHNIASLVQPCLVIGARDDLVVPMFLQIELANHIQNATTHFFENGGHFFPHSQNHPFVSLMENWLLPHRDD
jgi:pimeloyl-ACP methyl ester carboxylesterase